MLQTRWLTFGVAWLILLAGYYRLLAVPNRTPAQRVTVLTSLGYLMVVAWLVFAPVGLVLPDSYKALSYFYMVPYNLHPFVHVDPEFLANILLTGPLGGVLLPLAAALVVVAGCFGRARAGAGD